MVILNTNLGDIKLELFPNFAPITVKNFLAYAQNGLYEGAIFHRVIKNFMIQGGGFTQNFTPIKTFDPIINEANPNLLNSSLSIAMARTYEPNSATNQFFINTQDNHSLNFKDRSSNGIGYCVFGKVIAGEDVVTKIENSTTSTKTLYLYDILMQNNLELAAHTLRSNLNISLIEANTLIAKVKKHLTESILSDPSYILDEGLFAGTDILKLYYCAHKDVPTNPIIIQRVTLE